MSDSQELYPVLRLHLQRHPRMQAQDFFKLIHQNEFGGGHLVTSEQDSLERLLAEARGLDQGRDRRASAEDLLCEAIGNGLCRITLGKGSEAGAEWSTINKLFTLTAAAVAGSAISFQYKLSVLRKFFQDQALYGLLADLDALSGHYDFQGHPPIAHSAIYRQAYQPAYRVVRSEFIDFFQVFCRIDKTLRDLPAVRVAIDGMCGSGKSTLAKYLRQIYACDIIQMDHFFLPAELRTPQRLMEIGGNVDYERFACEVIPGLLSGQPFQYRAFDCAKMAMGKTVSVNPGRLTVIEGSYSQHPAISGSYNLRIFLQIDPQEQDLRVREREGTDRYRRFTDTWIPMENHYFEQMNIPGQSDLVLKLPRS
jgi:uridine kinase